MNNKKNTAYSVFDHGSAWLKTDFHLHTKADSNNFYKGDADYYLSGYIEKLKDNNIQIGVITNHNKFDHKEYMSLYKTAIKQEIYLLPGVELSVNDGANGIHTLVVFSDEWLENGQDYINQFLNVTFAGKTPGQYENENGRSQDNLIETIKKLEGYNRDFFIIFAHVEQKSGLWNELDGGRLEELGENELFRRRTAAFQKVRTHDTEKKCRIKIQSWLKDWYPAEVEGSDCKTIDDVGKTEDCFMKLSHFTFEAVKYALSDWQNRIAKVKPIHSKSYLKSISFEGGVLAGKSVFFASELNTLIGIRGSGKSSIVESLRYVLDIPFGEKAQDDKYKRELIRHTLGSGGKATIKAIDRFGQEYEIRRILNELPEVLVNGTLQPGVTIKETVIYKPIYFGQKDLSSSGEGFERDLVEKLIGERITDIRTKIEEHKKRVQDAIKKFQKISTIDEKLKEYTESRDNAEFRLRQFKELRIEEKLKKQIDFESDTRKCRQIISETELFVGALDDVLTQHEDEIKNHLKYKSEQNEKFFEDFYKSYSGIISAVDSIKLLILKSKSSLAELSGKENELAKIRNAFKEEFAVIERQLSESLKSKGMQSIRTDDFKQISKTLEQAKSMLEALNKEKSKSEQVKLDLIKEMSVLNGLWHEEWKIIQNELDRVNVNHSSLVIRNEYKGDRLAFIQFMKDYFRGSKIREASFEKIADVYPDFHELFKSSKKAEAILGNSWYAFEEYFNEHMESLFVWQKPNRFVIEYHGKELKDHSLGQRASALILFVLSQKENDVIIIDQPEDDLDNQTIYQDVIKLLKSIKPHTQFIFATHNPNIPVLGDAEQIISCSYSNEAVELEQGGIDNPHIQKEIVAIMEGGQEAFNKRKEIYRIWKPLS